MPYSLSVGEAAGLLGISETRVKQLIAQGSIDAVKIGGRWLVDDQSVNARKEESPRAGRPRPSSSAVQTYTLMNRTHEVLDFTFDRVTSRFGDAHRIVDPLRAPIGLVSPRGAKVSAQALAYWRELGLTAKAYKALGREEVTVTGAGLEKILEGLAND